MIWIERFAVPAYVVETATERILIDTGLNPSAIADPAAYYDRPDVFAVFALEQEQSVADQLDVDTLTKVVLTHLHWDHVGGSIELLSTPGHTPGHQSVRIGDLVLGADVVHFASGLDDHRFPVFADDHEQQGRSADQLRGLRDAGLTVMPGHDPDVLCPGPVSA